MRKPKRKKLTQEYLENLLAKYERRIQRLAEEAYQIREALEAFKPIVVEAKEEMKNDSAI